MDKKNKGLADDQEGDFILNESGTSVNIDDVEADVPPIEQLRDDVNDAENEPALEEPGDE